MATTYDLGEKELGAFVYNRWQHLILRLYTRYYRISLNVFKRSLRVASKSPAKIDLYGVAKHADISKLKDLKQVAFGDSVKLSQRW